MAPSRMTFGDNIEMSVLPPIKVRWVTLLIFAPNSLYVSISLIDYLYPVRDPPDSLDLHSKASEAIQRSFEWNEKLLDWIERNTGNTMLVFDCFCGREEIDDLCKPDKLELLTQCFNTRFISMVTSLLGVSREFQVRSFASSVGSTFRSAFVGLMGNALQCQERIAIQIGDEYGRSLTRANFVSD